MRCTSVRIGASFCGAGDTAGVCNRRPWVSAARPAPVPTRAWTHPGPRRLLASGSFGGLLSSGRCGDRGLRRGLGDHDCAAWPGSGAGPSTASDAPYRPGGPRTPPTLRLASHETSGKKGQPRPRAAQASPPSSTHPSCSGPAIAFFLECAALNTEQLLALSSFLCLYLNTDFHVKRVLSVGFDIQER